MGRKKKEYEIYNNYVSIKKPIDSCRDLTNHHENGAISTFTFKRLINQYYKDILNIGGGYYLFKETPLR